MDEACPLPWLGDGTSQRRDESDIIRTMLQASRIAIVGLSDDPSRVSHHIAHYLIEHGKTVVPVNPMIASAVGLKSFPRLVDVPGPIELVNVFRRSEFCADVVRDAIAAGAKGVWLQSGITNEEARRLAADAGMPFVQDRCIMVELMRRK
jgi:predicted CoA-binding protein